jgi:hypothetical protein
LNLGEGLEICRLNPRKIKIRAIGSLLVREEGAGTSPAKFQRGAASGVEKDWPMSIRSSRRVQGWAWEGEELTGGWVPTADRSGGGEELIGERFPGEEGGQVLVQHLQQEERKLLGWLDRSE